MKRGPFCISARPVEHGIFPRAHLSCQNPAHHIVLHRFRRKRYAFSLFIQKFRENAMKKIFF